MPDPSERSASGQGWTGRRAGKYLVGELLGEGGMGHVYKAQDPTLNRPVALKLVREGSQEALLRLMLEAQALARVEHANICHIHEVGEAEGRPFIAMQFVPGETLERLAPRLSMREKAALVKTVAEAMHAAHGLGLVHRDLKPANIMVEGEPGGALVPVVLDFGLVHLVQGPGLTRTGMTLGTPAFMSPEQAHGEAARVDRRSDIFSLGATLYAVLLGQSPFQASNSMETLRRLVDEEPEAPRRRDPAIPKDLETILMRCLEKEPARRYDTAKALAEDLGRFLEGEPILARPQSAVRRLLRRARRNRAASAVAGSAALLLLLMGGWFLHLRIRDRRQAELLRAYAQEAERQEGRLRAATLLPLHDMGPEEAELRAWMAQVRETRERQGSEADAPAAFALGRGHLLLREYREARAQLQRAWDLGLRGPEVAIPLARALGQLYQRGMDEVTTEGDEAARRSAEAKLGREFRDPALALLRAHTAERPGQQAYQEGLIALYEGREGDVVARCREAQRQDPGLFEAWALEGDAWFAQGDFRARSGDARAAEEDWRQAEGAYRQALDMARSSPDLLAAVGRLERYRAQSAGQFREAPEAGYRRAIQVQEQVLAVDPVNRRAHLERIHAWLLLGYGREDRGRNPVEAYEGALRCAKEAVARLPRDPAVQAYEGTVLVAQGDYARNHGDPASAQTRARAREAFGRAKALNPTDYTYLDEYIWMLTSSAQEALDQERDPEPFVHEALDEVGPRLIVSKGGAYDAHFALSQILGFQARHLARRGEDPSSAFALALQHGRKAFEMIPTNSSICDCLGRDLLWRAEYERAHGGAAAATVDEGLSLMKDAVQKNPTLMAHHQVLGSLFSFKAQLAMDAGQDPSPFLAGADRSLRRALELDPRHVDHLEAWKTYLSVKARAEAL